MSRFGQPQTQSTEDVKIEETIPTPKTAPAPAAAPAEVAQPTVIVSEIDAYLHDRLKSQPKVWGDVKVIGDAAPNDSWHVLRLPKDVDEAFQKRGLTPRWINKDKKSIDRALDIRGWMLVNRMLFPEIKKHHYTANGTVERGDAILGFMPNERAERLRRIPGELSLEKMKNLPIEKWKDQHGDRFYKPTLSEEKDGEEIAAGIQPDNNEA